MTLRLATIRTPTGTTAVRITDEGAIDLGVPDVGSFLTRDHWREDAKRSDEPTISLENLDYAPVVVAPEKIICVGLNYRNHILEMGREIPEYPTLFAKYSRALVGAYDEVMLPAGSEKMDWEAELGVVIGSTVRSAEPGEAAAAIAGYTVVNDVTARDFQYRTPQWLQGKTFEATTPLGPWLVTSDDPAAAAGHWRLWCEVDGERMQEADTADLVFGPPALVSYCSTVITLEPGDVIATGTPGGVGAGRKPPRFLADGQEVVTVVEGIGELRNRCRREKR